MRAATRLIKTKGPKALEYANRKAELMQDRGDEEDVVYWHRISKQIEILLYSDD